MRKNIIFIVLVFILQMFCGDLPREGDDMSNDTFVDKRRDMVEKQIQARGVVDSLVLNSNVYLQCDAKPVLFVFNYPNRHSAQTFHLTSDSWIGVR